MAPALSLYSSQGVARVIKGVNYLLVTPFLLILLACSGSTSFAMIIQEKMGLPRGL